MTENPPAMWKPADGQPFHGFLLLTPENAPRRRAMVRLPACMVHDEARAALEAEQELADRYHIGSHPWEYTPPKRYEYTSTHAVVSWGDVNKNRPDFKQWALVPPSPGSDWEVCDMDMATDGPNGYAIKMWTWRREVAP